MKLLSTRIRGLGPFADASLDLAALSPEQLLVAVVGENGAGKTTSLELAMLGAVFRTLPTAGGGGSLVSFASMRGASVESLIAIRDGRLVRFRQTVDPVSGGGESAIIDEATGAPLITSTKVTEADAWVRANLPPLDVVTASLFSAQGSGGVLAMKAADRKRLLLRVHGIERIEKLEAAAAKHARDAKGVRATVQARRDEAERAVVEVSDEQLEVATLAEADARTTLVEAETRLTSAREALAAERAKATARLAYEQALDRAKREHAQARGVVAGIETKLANNRTLVEHEAEIRDAHALVAKRREELDVAEHDGKSAETAHLLAQGMVARAASDLRLAETRLASAAAERQRASERLSRHEVATKALPALDAAAKALREAEAAEGLAAFDLDELQAAQTGRSATRINGLREGLVAVADSELLSEACEDARDVLTRDNLHAEADATFPENLRAFQHAHREARAVTARARARHTEAVRAVEGIDEDAGDAWQLADSDVYQAEDAVREARAKRERVVANAAEASVGWVHAQDRSVLVAAGLAAAERALHALTRGAPDALVRLDQARARIEELEGQLATALTARDACEAAERALVEAPAPVSNLAPALDDEGDATSAVESAQAALRARAAELAALRARAEDARRGRERVAALDAELAAADRELTRWSRLAADLGKDGVQAHLVDAVGPELSALVNELLHACVSTRWTVTIATTRTIATGEAREALELRVMDAESGREGGVETFSGGERVLLGEAISLALTVAACRTAGLEGVSLVRDESGAALDAENARRYVAMLRRAAGMVSASRVLLVSHGRDVVAECDAAIRVRDGAIEVVPVEEV